MQRGSVPLLVNGEEYQYPTVVTGRELMSGSAEAVDLEPRDKFTVLNVQRQQQSNDGSMSMKDYK